MGRGWEKQVTLISLTCKMLLLFFKYKFISFRKTLALLVGVKMA